MSASLWPPGARRVMYLFIEGVNFISYTGTVSSFGGSNQSICINSGIPYNDPNYEFHYGKASSNAWNAWTD